MSAAQFVLLLIVFLLLLFIFIPLDIESYFVIGEKERFSVKIRWLFGLIHKELDKKEKRTKKEKKAKKKKPSKRPRRPRNISEPLSDREFMRRVKVLVEELISALQFRNLKARLRFGLDDPSDTGFLFGYLCALQPLLASFQIDARFEPSFDEEVIEGYAKGSLRLWPIKIILPIVRFMASIKTIRILMGLAMRRR